MPHSGEPGTSAPSENQNAFPSRRELRAQREAGSAPSDASVEVPAESIPMTSVPLASVPAVSTPGADQDVALIVAQAGRRSGVSSTPLARTPAARRGLASAASAPRPAPRPARVSNRRSPLKIAVTLLAIPGLFLTAGLPAYAFSPGAGANHGAASTRSLAEAGAQGVTVAAGASAVTVARDGFTATSKEELAQKEADAKRALAAQKAAESARATAASFAVYGVRAEGDDYQWYNMPTESQGGGFSPFNYYYRECVDFVAWRLNRDAGSTSAPFKWTWSSLTPSGGNASNWANAWSSHGWPTSKTPVVGAVAWFNFNHVAYVQSVGGDGSVVLEEYNWMGSHAYNKRTIKASEVPLFLYPPA
ncbi:CHAP domain-containing protein [Cryobacterium mannosilyticum]|uniref:CHAP domain-containing protein n=2 Tax=Cryobacterium mannosilyticum TaxID=1259190 RepID=A0A4R8WE62_9MICO|nr:CHAP domain-containing protein [Cryobacterium mannosilyticum]